MPNAMLFVAVVVFLLGSTASDAWLSPKATLGVVLVGLALVVAAFCYLLHELNVVANSG